MLFVIDIGNTNITMGACEGKTISVTGRLKTADCTARDVCSTRIKAFVGEHHLPRPSGAILCSVVPHVTPTVVEAIKKGFEIEPVAVSSTLKTGLIFSIRNPAALGADRIANAAGAHALYGGNLLVIDFGTATTLCFITETGEYRGGAIMPGPGMSAEALAEKTAKLPRVTLTQPRSVLGDDTAAHIASGILYGQAGAVERFVTEIKNDMGGDLTVIVTGGYAELILPYLKAARHDPLLTLQGLRVLYELNVEKQRLNP